MAEAGAPARRRLPVTAFMPGLPHSNSAILAPIGLRRLPVLVMRIFRDTTVFGERHCQVNSARDVNKARVTRRRAPACHDCVSFGRVERPKLTQS